MCLQFPSKALTHNLAQNYVTPKDYKLGFHGDLHGDLHGDFSHTKEQN